jgi:hypothetical protein
MSVSFTDWLTSEIATSAILTIGNPVCGFVIAYAVAVRWGALRRRVQPGARSYFLAALAGAAIALGGQLVALGFSSVAAAAAPPGDPDGTAETTWLGVSLLWPVAWCLLAVVILLATRQRLAPPARSVVAALAVGILFSLLTFVGLFDIAGSITLHMRLPFFAAFLAVAIVVLVVAAPRSRDAGRDRATG